MSMRDNATLCRVTESRFSCCRPPLPPLLPKYPKHAMGRVLGIQLVTAHLPPHRRREICLYGRVSCLRRLSFAFSWTHYEKYGHIFCSGSSPPIFICQNWTMCPVRHAFRVLACAEHQNLESRFSCSVAFLPLFRNLEIEYCI